MCGWVATTIDVSINCWKPLKTQFPKPFKAKSLITNSRPHFRQKTIPTTCNVLNSPTPLPPQKKKSFQNCVFWSSLSDILGTPPPPWIATIINKPVLPGAASAVWKAWWVVEDLGGRPGLCEGCLVTGAEGGPGAGIGNQPVWAEAVVGWVGLWKQLSRYSRQQRSREHKQPLKTTIKVLRNWHNSKRMS